MTRPWGWADACRSAPWRRNLLAGLAALVALAFAVPAVFTAVRQRPGAVPWEPVLDHLPTLQLSLPIFAVQYATIALVAVRMIRRPDLLPRAVHAVALLVTLRMVTIGMVALDPPPDLVTLHDPINQVLYGGTEPVTRDLFFSGHTALMVLLILLAEPGVARRLAAAGTVAVAVMLLLQHVHWTIDVLAAPGFAVLAWWLSGRSAPAVVGPGSRPPGR